MAKGKSVKGTKVTNSVKSRGMNPAGQGPYKTVAAPASDGVHRENKSGHNFTKVKVGGTASEGKGSSMAKRGC